MSNGKVIVSDGSMFTVYEPGDEGGPRQYMRSPVREEGLPSALGFLTGTSRLDEDFSIRLRNPAQFRWDGEILEIRPRRAEPGYRRAFLYVDGTTRGVVQKVLIQDHDGNLNRFTFRRMRFNGYVAPSRFAFRPPTGARRI